MKELVLTYPDDLPHSLKLSEREFAEEVRFLAAAKLYELGRLTASKAAELAALDRLTFLARLAAVGVSAINLREEEVVAEVEAARELAG